MLAVHDCPSTIEVMAEYPGSPQAKITWSFPGESSDLTQFRVELAPEGKEVTAWDVPSSKMNQQQQVHIHVYIYVGHMINCTLIHLYS